jgi:G protein beta subunit-like protein
VAGNPYVIIYDANPGQSPASRPAQYAGHQTNVTDLVFDGDTFYTSSEDKTWQVWDRRDSQGRSSLKGASESGLNSLGLIRSAKQLVTANEKGHIELWSISEAKLIGSIKLSPLPIRWLGLSQDCQHVIAGGHDENLYIVDIRSSLSAGHEPPTTTIPKAHNGPILRVAVAPDGRSFTTTSADSTSKIWNYPDCSLRHHLSHLEQTKWIWDAAYTPDSQYVVTAGTDKICRTWNAETGALEHCFSRPPPGKGLTALALFP